MSTSDETSRLQGQLVRLREQLAALRASNASAQQINEICQVIADCKAALRSSGFAVDDSNDDAAPIENRYHSLTVSDNAQVDVAIAGDLYGNIIYRLLPARVPRYPSEEEIAQANELLGYMPIPPADPPAQPRPFLLSGIFPLRHNSLFVGRDAMLQELAQRLKPVGAKAAISTGIGGVGKTTLAAEFAHRYGAFFAGGVFWISCADPGTIETQVANYGGPGGLEVWHPDEKLSLKERVARVKRQWESELPRLLIFDNCDDWADAKGDLSAEQILQEWLPPSGGCRVLVTSRRQEWDARLGVVDIFLDVLARPASITLLQSLANHLTHEEADQVAEAMGDLPLALYLAGGYLRRYRHETSVDQFLEELLQIDPIQHPSLQGQGSAYPPTRRYLERERTEEEAQAELNVARVFALSFSHLQASDPTDAAAIALLARAACLAPGAPFARPLLLDTLEIDEADGQFTAIEGLERLVALGMLEKQGDEDLRIHRLISGFASQSINDTDAQGQVEQVVVINTHHVVNQGIPASLMPLLPHLQHCYQRQNSAEDLRTAELAMALGRAEQEQISYTKAEPLLRQALAIRQRQLGEEHPDTASSLNNLAALYREQGRYEEAASLLQQALTIRQRLLGEEHNDTATSLNNLAELYQGQGRYSEAETLFQQALAIWRKQLGEEHLTVATSLNNLAELCRLQGRYEEAEPLLKQALDIRREQLGEQHPSTATSLNNLAELYRLQGRYGEAEPLYQQALTIWRKQLGEEHPDTALSLNNLAALYEKQGRYGEAEPLYRQALAITQKLLGEHHLSVGISLNNLAELYRLQGRYGEAEPLYQQALVIWREQLGEEHPSTATSLNNFALLYKAQGRYEEAETLYFQALTIRQKRLGEDHPDTATSLNNLAGVYYAQERYGEAEPLYFQALTIRQKRLGEEHPSTAASLNNLAELYRRQERYEEAEALYQRALAIWRKQLGGEHPYVANCLNNLAGLYLQQCRYQEAEEFFKHAISTYERLVGENHPNTHNSRAGLELCQQLGLELSEAEQAVAEALGNPAIDREELVQQLEELAQSAESGEEAGSPWRLLAGRLRELAAKLQAGSRA
jgi:ATP-dependent transcriptional regulator